MSSTVATSSYNVVPSSPLGRSPTSSLYSSPPPVTPPTLHLDLDDDDGNVDDDDALCPSPGTMLCPTKLNRDDLSKRPTVPCVPAFRFTVSPASGTSSPITPRTANKRRRPPVLDIIASIAGRQESHRSPKRPRSASRFSHFDLDSPLDSPRLQSPRRPGHGKTMSLQLRMPSPAGSEDDAPLSARTVTPELLNGMQQVKLARDPSPPLLDIPPSLSTRRGSPPMLASMAGLKRANPKALSLTLSLGSSSFHNTASSSSSTDPTPTTASYPAGVSDSTPLTPGPPKTPSPSSTMISSIRAQPTKPGGRRPSLLSLITAPPRSSAVDVPPTPGGVNLNPLRSRGHARMRSAGTISATMYEMDPRGPQSASQSAFPSLRGGFAPIEETHADPGMSPSTSVTSSWASNLDSLSTPSTTPPLEEDEFQAPYADGPRELIPGVWIGAEDSTHHFDIWGRGSSTVAVVNVAQELENPFADGADLEAIAAGWTSYKGKAVVALTNHAADSTRPNIEYAHLRWSHGEGGLCDIPASAAVSQLIDPASPDAEDTNSEKWRFWEAICWIEAHRRAGIPVMIHCQCGVSRSATLAVAYIMSVAAAGLVPETLGQLRTMQNAYDFVKGRSPWIGPNVSLVFQLVEYARHLSSLLSDHVSIGGKAIETSWPTLVNIETEAAWEQRRREFDENETAAEARALDEAMVQRATTLGL